ncbi:E3 ubiquitin-protein ligase Hakai-like, partial [Penaeus indicus]|uniref:E3 ubiquitin-protein ligase Hakai-like n=1 Tax=Penaeus indicus TaxID=29960 RepID=UPI00300CFA34
TSLTHHTITSTRPLHHTPPLPQSRCAFTATTSHYTLPNHYHIATTSHVPYHITLYATIITPHHYHITTITLPHHTTPLPHHTLRHNITLIPLHHYTSKSTLSITTSHYTITTPHFNPTTTSHHIPPPPSSPPTTNPAIPNHHYPHHESLTTLPHLVTKPPTATLHVTPLTITTNTIPHQSPHYNRHINHQPRPYDHTTLSLRTLTTTAAPLLPHLDFTNHRTPSIPPDSNIHHPPHQPPPVPH